MVPETITPEGVIFSYIPPDVFKMKRFNLLCWKRNPAMPNAHWLLSAEQGKLQALQEDDNMTDTDKLQAKGIEAICDSVCVTAGDRGIDLSPSDTAFIISKFLERLANASPPHPMDMDFRAMAVVLVANINDE